MSESLRLSSGLFMGTSRKITSISQRPEKLDPYIVLHLILKTAAQDFRKLLEKLGEVVIGKAQAPQFVLTNRVSTFEMKDHLSIFCYLV
ncbi:hypothetical protein AKJ16_DCAP17706 [Drosera capensis]